MAPHRRSPGLLLAAACVFVRAGLTLWTDSVLSCDGRHSSDHLGFGREVFDMETRMCGRRESTNATLGAVDMLQHCTDGSRHVAPHHGVRNYLKKSPPSVAPQGQKFPECGGSVIVGYSKSGTPLFSNTTLCHQGTMDVLKRRRKKKLNAKSKSIHTSLPSDDIFKTRKSRRGAVPPIHSAAWNQSLTNLTGVYGSSWNHSLANLTSDSHQCGGSIIVGYSKSGTPLFSNTTLCHQGTMDVLKRRRKKKLNAKSKSIHTSLPSDDIFKTRKSRRGAVPPIHSAAWNQSLTNLTGVYGSSWNHSLANLTSDSHQCGGSIIVGYSKSGTPLFSNTTLCHQGTMDVLKRRRKKKLNAKSKSIHTSLPSDDIFKTRKSRRGAVPPIHSAAWNQSLTNLTGVYGSSWNHSLANLTSDSHQCGGSVIVGYSKSGTPLFSNTTLCHQGTMDVLKRRRKKKLNAKSKSIHTSLPSDDIFKTRKSRRGAVPPIHSAAWNQSLTNLTGVYGSSWNHSLANLTSDSHQCGGSVIVGYSKSGTPLFSNTTLCHQGTMDVLKRRRKKKLNAKSKSIHTSLPSDDIFKTRKSRRGAVPPIHSAAWNQSLTNLTGVHGSSWNHSLANLTSDSHQCGGSVIVGYSKSGTPLFSNTTLCHQGTMDVLKRRRKKKLNAKSKSIHTSLPSDDIFKTRKSRRGAVPPIHSAAWNQSLTNLTGVYGSSWNHSLANLTSDSHQCGGSVIVGYSKSGTPLFSNTTLCHQGTMDVLKRRRKKKLNAKSKSIHTSLPSDDIFKTRKSRRGAVPPIHSAAWNQSLTNLTGVYGSSWNHSLANLTSGP
ncbi:uncharacterized protein [Takifugu rubripes]|uniref:uncharacterized protein n=1 Tax=Takifugu rubripes TaxID=31033 RepID=UPI001145646C|nr:uncharacterized protein LOC105419550 [Takifugu rubripes]